AERLRGIMTELVTRASAAVRRYAGTVDKFTGDGIMALFGAPAALENHALRACLAALSIQASARQLASELERSDGVDLWLRVGLNSGTVITGEIGPSTLGYTAIGEQVGMAKRMESIAPPGTVMLSESTARLVEGAVILQKPQLVHVKGVGDAVQARQLVSVARQPRRLDGPQSTLVGRRWELTALSAILDRAINGTGSVVSLTGPAGIGKTRLVREVEQIAKGCGVSVFRTFCDSHATDVHFRAMTRLLRAVAQIVGLDDEAARARVRARVPPDADPQDVLLLNDLLGIGDPAAKLPKIDPDARRRRLTALVNGSQLGLTRPAVFVVEDVHWIDKASESMFADCLTVIPQTPALMLLTYRPEYRGALRIVPGAQTFALAPLSGSDASKLVTGLLGPDPSVDEIANIIAERAAGNPLFAKEITRELVERGVLDGERGYYVCDSDVAEVGVPATLQATIAARIDRLSPGAKHMLCAAAVIGFRFGADLLASLEVEIRVDELVEADLVDQVRFTACPEYAFRHPLIRTVAYESLLKSDRTQMHRRLAAVLEARDPKSVEENSALIAEHLESAGDLHAAFAWHMRAGTWALNRDVAAARLSWERASKIADALPAEDPDRAAMRITPRTKLYGFAWRIHSDISEAGFDELRELCTAAEDKPSLAIAMAGLVMDHLYQGRVCKGAELASEAMDLIQSVSSATVTVGLSLTPILAKAERGEWPAVMQWSQTVIDLADGDPAKGNFIVGSPLALALTTRAIARYFLDCGGWRDDLTRGLAMARSADPMSYATVVAYVYFPGIPYGVLKPDDHALGEIEDALRIAERSGEDLALVVVGLTLGVALLHRNTDAERDRGHRLLADIHEGFLREGRYVSRLPLVNMYLAREKTRRGDRDEAISLMRTTVDHLFSEDRLLGWGIPATGLLVEALLERAAAADVAEAEFAIDRLATMPTADGVVVRDIMLMRLRTLSARARGDSGLYARFRNRYRAMAVELQFDGHVAWAEEMP
ncbi:ATP-binding protein, partial [Mycobacterium montefiorense]|uniref:ATP-binding protein n=1 Tax=Mycobacterium montefiorense TaxID=154654 RepID=UPI00223101D1